MSLREFKLPSLRDKQEAERVLTNEELALKTKELKEDIKKVKKNKVEKKLGRKK